MRSIQVLTAAACALVGITFSSNVVPAHWSQPDRSASSATAREALPSGQGDEYDTLVTVRQISDRALVVMVAGGETTNIVALRTAQGVVVVDTTVSPVLARAVRRRIDQTFGGAPIVAVINTHGHGDHAYGNQVFAGVPIVGHTGAPSDLAASHESLGRNLAAIKAAVARLEAQLRTLDATSDKALQLQATVLYYKAMLEGLSARFTATSPWVTFTDRLELDLGDRRLELTAYGAAHSASDIVIHCPEEGLWMTGDLFAAGRDPYVDSERIAAFDRWAVNLDRILSSATTTRAIVPGHGALLSAGDLQKTREFVRTHQKLYAGKESGFAAFRAIHERTGVDEAVTALRRFTSEPTRYFVLHLEFDTYAYRLMNSGRLDDALKIFMVLAEYFPEDWQSFDSLGEVQLKLGQAGLAAESFRKSLTLDPTNRNAIEKLKTLEKKVEVSGRTGQTGRGPYLGQEPPGATPRLFAPGVEDRPGRAAPASPERGRPTDDRVVVSRGADGLAGSTPPRNHYVVPDVKTRGAERMVEVGGRKLHAIVYGQGAPTVVLVSGTAGASQASWNPVIDPLAAEAAVVTYDRAGVGRSEIGSLPTDARQSALDLRRLLDELKVPRPILLVGHSYGVMIVKLFASLFPDGLDGLVLMDGVPATVVDAQRAILTGADLERLEKMTARASAPPNPRTELDYIFESRAQELKMGPLPRVPTLVLIAGAGRENGVPPGFSPEARRKMAQLGVDLQKKMATDLGGRFIVLDDVSHSMHLERPEPIILAIKEMIQRIQALPADLR